MNGNPNPPIGKRFLPGHTLNSSRNRFASPYYQAVMLQRLCIDHAQRKKIRPGELAALAKAWDVLEERKRILRGVPLPGQLRPDLDPVQLMKAAKRARTRGALDLPSRGMLAQFSDGDEPPEDDRKPARVTPTKTTTPKPAPV